MIELRFFLAVTPKATARNRCGCHGKFPTSYLDPSYRKWLDEALPILAAADPVPPELRERPMSIGVEVVAKRPKTSKLWAPRGDLDNYEKGLWDAMTKSGLFWKDDNQLVRSFTKKRWSEGDEPEGYHVTLQIMEPGDAA